MRKLVIRGDDVGYSEVCNIGSFEAIEKGIVTSADVMLDVPGTEDALRRLREYPWISIGWHTHFWGSPVLGKEKVPTLFDEERDGFRMDISSPDVDYEEALSELRAEVQRCVDILGKAPDVGGTINAKPDSVFGKALQQVHDEYEIVTDFMGMDLGLGRLAASASEKWAERKINIRGLLDYCVPLMTPPLSDTGYTDSITNVRKYDPVGYYLEDKSGLLNAPEDEITVHAWHPGYLDSYVYMRGDYSPGALVFKGIRTVDVYALTSPEVHNWIRDNHIELINMRDALYGTHEYQDHLKQIGSDLAVVYE